MELRHRNTQRDAQGDKNMETGTQRETHGGRHSQVCIKSHRERHTEIHGKSQRYPQGDTKTYRGGIDMHRSIWPERDLYKLTKVQTD